MSEQKITNNSKFKAWTLKNKFHREDGPAIEYDNGFNEWYLNGKNLSEDLYLKITKGPIKDLPLYLGMGFDKYISQRLKGN